MGKTYKNIILDIGDVLLHYRWKACIMDYGVSEEDAQRIGDELFEDPKGLWTEWDLGTYTAEELKTEYAKQFPEDMEVISYFIDHGEYMSLPNPQVWKRVHALKEAGYHIYLLSNYSKELFEKHMRYADFMKDIDGKIVSYEFHIKKPDPAIYQLLFDTYDLNPSECIFFDDRLENVEGAKKEGMDAVQVTGQEMLVQELEKLL